MSKKCNIIIIIILLISIIMFGCFFYMTFKLWRFRYCYDNNFELPYCEKYKDF